MDLNRVESRVDGRTDRVIRAAGAVLWRPGPDCPRIGLIHRARYDDWSFPKGKLRPGEHPLLAAAREVFEETGHRMVVGRRLPMISYEVDGLPKRVRYWAGRAIPAGAGSTPFEPNDEVDRLIWVSPAEAERRLTRWLDVTVLDSFRAAPVDTVPLVLLRHGEAARRGADYPDDQRRPLTDAGAQQAEMLVPLLSCFGPLNVITSPALRCVDTVRPYADSRHALLDVDPVLTESAHAAAPRAAAAWMRSLIADARPTVACSHRPVLDALFTAALPAGLASARQAVRADAPKPLINGRAWSRKETERYLGPESEGCRLPTAGAWVLHTTPRLSPRRLPQVVALDRLKP